MCPFPANLLIPDGCDAFLQNCRMDTCTNVCSKLVDESFKPTTKPTYSTDDPVNVYIGSSEPGRLKFTIRPLLELCCPVFICMCCVIGVVISYEPYPPKGKPTQERRKRELVGDGTYHWITSFVHLISGCIFIYLSLFYRSRNIDRHLC